MGGKKHEKPDSISEALEAQGGKGSLRIGDIILFNFDDKVYRDLRSGPTNQEEGANHEELVGDQAQEKSAANDNLKARIT